MDIAFKLFFCYKVLNFFFINFNKIYIISLMDFAMKLFFFLIKYVFFYKNFLKNLKKYVFFKHFLFS